MAWAPIKLRKGGDISFVGEAEGTGGGSVPYEHIVVPLAWDTPNFVIPATGPVGIKITDLNPGDVALGVPGAGLGFFSVSEAWDGTTPQLQGTLTSGRGDLPGVAPVNAPSAQLSFANSPFPIADVGAPEVFACQPESVQSAALVVLATALWVYYDDSAGGDPGSSMGQGEYHLFVARAAV